MTNPLDPSQFTPVESIAGQDEAETFELRSMLDDAEAFLKSFSWCPRIAERYFGFGVGGVVGLFLFRLEERIGDSDEWLWVVVGDLPSAYFVTDESRTVPAAMATYCQLMEDWAAAVDTGQGLEDVFPVAAAPTRKMPGS